MRARTLMMMSMVLCTGATHLACESKADDDEGAPAAAPGSDIDPLDGLRGTTWVVPGSRAEDPEARKRWRARSIWIFDDDTGLVTDGGDGAESLELERRGPCLLRANRPDGSFTHRVVVRADDHLWQGSPVGLEIDGTLHVCESLAGTHLWIDDSEACHVAYALADAQCAVIERTPTSILLDIDGRRQPLRRVDDTVWLDGVRSQHQPGVPFESPDTARTALDGGELSLPVIEPSE